MKPEEKPQEPRCGTCGGRDVGIASGEGWIPCPACKPLKTPCRVCRGGGSHLMYEDKGIVRTFYQEPCQTCKGTGYEEKP